MIRKSFLGFAAALLLALAGGARAQNSTDHTYLSAGVTLTSCSPGMSMTACLNTIFTGIALPAGVTVPTVSCPNNSQAPASTAFVDACGPGQAQPITPSSCPFTMTAANPFVYLPAHVSAQCVVTLPLASTMGNQAVTIYDVAGTLAPAAQLLVQINTGGAGTDTISIPNTSGAGLSTETSQGFSQPGDWIVFLPYNNGTNWTWSLGVCDIVQGCISPLARQPFIGGQILISSGCAGGSMGGNDGTAGFSVTFGGTASSTQCALQIPKGNWTTGTHCWAQMDQDGATVGLYQIQPATINSNNIVVTFQAFLYAGGTFSGFTATHTMSGACGPLK